MHTYVMRSAEKTPSRRQTEIGASKKQREFEKLFDRFRAATDSDEFKRLGDKLGRMIFGGCR